MFPSFRLAACLGYLKPCFLRKLRNRLLDLNHVVFSGKTEACGGYLAICSSKVAKILYGVSNKVTEEMAPKKWLYGISLW